MVPNYTAQYAYQAENAADDRERLILEHLPQVKWIAIRIHESLNRQVPLDDLISAGVIGLINAIDNFDSSLNVKLKTYAEFRIRGAILDSLPRDRGVPRDRRKRLNEIQRAIVDLEARLLRSPTEEEIATHLGISLEMYQDWLVSVQGVTIASLDAQPCEGESSFLNVIADASAESPSHRVERAQLEKLLATAIECMPKVERIVLSLYFKEEMNLREIAQILGLHHSRISQLKTQAILRLRANLERSWPAGRTVY